VLSHIQRIKPTIHYAQIGAHLQHCSIFNTHTGGTYPKDLSSAPESGTDIESTWVATLSNIFEKRNASSSRNVPGYGVGTEGYTYPYAPSQQPQVQLIWKRLPAKIFAHIRFQAQIIQYLRNQVAKGLMTREQAQERLTVLQTSAARAIQEQNAPQQIPAQPILTRLREPEEARVWQQIQQQQHSVGESIHVTTPQQQQQVRLVITPYFLPSLESA
jgi:hypothetical protein